MAGGGASPSTRVNAARWRGDGRGCQRYVLVKRTSAGSSSARSRARVYDPRVGRFTTRDPVEGDRERPETWNPYVFAASNPNVYRDPEGLFTIVGLNVSQAIQGILRNIPRTIARALLEEVKDEAVAIAGRAALNAVTGSLPVATVPSSILARGMGRSRPGVQAVGAILGQRFENLISGSVCAFFNGASNGGRGLDRLWSQVSMNRRTGQPTGDGISCAAQVAGRHRVSVGRGPRPDFLFSGVPPTQLRRNRRSWLRTPRPRERSFHVDVNTGWSKAWTRIGRT